MGEERMEVAKKFLSHVQISEAVAQNTEVTSSHLEKIQNIWEKEEELVKKQEGKMSMEECLLDLTVLEITGKDLASCLKRIKPNANSFSLSEFADKMNAKYSIGEKYDWKSVSDKANPILNRMPGFPLLLGTFNFGAPIDMASRKRKAPEPRPKDVKVDKQQKAERIVTAEKKPDIDWHKFHFVIESLNHCYAENENQPIPLYDFILHPTNFTRTVENIFQVSFLIREGRALIEVEGDELFISPMKKTVNSSGKDFSKAKQCIFSITMPQWRELVELRGIMQPAICWQDDENVDFDFKVESPYRD